MVVSCTSLSALDTFKSCSKVACFLSSCKQRFKLFNKICFTYEFNNMWIIHSFIKQLLVEVEHDIINYQNQGLSYLPKPKAEADNTETRF